MNFLTQTYMVMGVDALGALLIFVALLTNKLDDFSIKYRVAIALVGIGFLGQMAMLAQLLPMDVVHYPYPSRLYWLIKDVGVVLWCSFAFYDIQFKKLYLRICSHKRDGVNVKHS